MLFSHQVLSDPLLPWIAARQAFLSFTISWSLLKFLSIESVMLSNCLILCHPFRLCLESFPASGSFPVSRLFTSAIQSTGAPVSASVLPIQGWFLLGLTGLISLQSKGLSRVFSNITVQKHQFFSTRPSLWSNCHILKFFGGSDSKESICLQCGRPGFDPWVGKIPWRRKWLSTPVFLSGGFQGQRSLASYKPWLERVGQDWATNTN